MTPPLVDLVVVGSVNADVRAEVRRLPRPGETMLAGADRPEELGGKGANQAVAAAGLGARVAIVAAVGDDDRGGRMIDELGARGVDTSAIVRAPGVSGWAHIVVDPSGENLIVVHPGTNRELSADEVTRAVRALRPRVVLTQLEIPEAAALAALAAGRDVGATTLCNASPSGVPVDLSRLTADVVLVNEHEAAELAGGPTDVGRVLARRGGSTLVVTRGADGVEVWTDGRSHVVPAVPVTEVVDTTGAGDAFAGALAATLAQGCSLDEAVATAVRAGAWAVGRVGTAGLSRAVLEEVPDVRRGHDGRV